MEHDALTYARKIEEKIQEIETIIDNLEDAADFKAEAISSYDRKLAITVLKLRNGLIRTMQDEDGSLLDIPSSLAVRDRELIAKGIVWQAALKKVEGEAGYKGLLSKLDARKAQLNGLQSINKVLQ